MIPTPEMIAMAERIGRSMDEASIYHEARKRMLSDMTGADIDLHIATVAGERAALTAIMETSEKAANLVVLEMVQEPDNEIDTTCNALVSDLYRAIRNGEHLR